MSRGPDAATLFERALLEGAERAGCPIAISDSEMVRWASATFVGARHRLALHAAASPAFDAWLAKLPEMEFALRGHLVADVVVERKSREGAIAAVALEALTVEEG